MVTAATNDVKTVQRKPKATDCGAELLPNMERFVTLMRQVKQRVFVNHWLSLLTTQPLTDVLWDELTVTRYLKTLFTAVAAFSDFAQQQLEQSALRIYTLSDDYGCDAVKSLLDEKELTDMNNFDKYSRALYLHLCSVTSKNDARFERAETIRQQNKKWKSEAYSSHFQGPKSVDIVMNDDLKLKLKHTIAQTYPQVAGSDVVIEHFQRRKLSKQQNNDDSLVALHTIVVNFNGKDTHYDKIVDGEIRAHNDQAVLSIDFAYDPASGALSVFTEEKSARVTLAKALRDVVFAADAQIEDMPLREFDLTGFTQASILNKLTWEPSDGISSIKINLIRVAKVTEREDDNGAHAISSDLTIRRDRYDLRDVFKVADEDFGLSDLSLWDASQVKLVLRMDAKDGRRAHNITVQITAPNGLNDNEKSEENRQLVLRLLKRWNVVREF